MNQIVTTANAYLPQEAAQMITADLYGRFISYLDASPKTVQTYTRSLRPFFRYLSETGTMQPTRETVLSYRDALKAAGYKPSTVQAYITAVRLFFQWTEQEGIYQNIANHVKGAKLDREHKKDYLTSRQVKRVLQTAKGESLQELRDYAILCLMFTAGLRTVEVTRANVNDLRTAGDETVLYIQGKGHEEKADFVKIAPETEDAIRAYLKARKVRSSTEPLFTSTSNNSKGKALTTRSVSGIVKSAMQAAGYDSERLTAHSTRHTAVTLALMAGESLQEVQQFARHRNLETTLIYSHNLDKAKNTCGASIAKSIF